MGILAVDVKGLGFRYEPPPYRGVAAGNPYAEIKGDVFDGVSLEIPMYSRALLLGANGSGKSTLLRILSGKHLVKKGDLKILGRDPFSGGDGGLVHYVGGNFPLEFDVSVEDLLQSFGDVSGAYKKELLDLLGIRPTWRMHAVSSGQRRRVDLLLSLLRPPKLFLLDEVTSELDILMRQELLAWLKTRCQEKKMTVVFATHILDGLEKWADQLVFLSPTPKSETLFHVRYSGSMKKALGAKPLLTLCNTWLKADKKVRKLFS